MALLNEELTGINETTPLHDLQRLYYASRLTDGTVPGLIRAPVVKPQRMQAIIPMYFMGDSPTSMASISSSSVKRYSLGIDLQRFHAWPDTYEGVILRGCTTTLTVTATLKFFDDWDACDGYNGTSETYVVHTGGNVSLSGTWPQEGIITLDRSKLEHTYPYCKILFEFNTAGSVYVRGDWGYIGAIGEE